MSARSILGLFATTALLLVVPHATAQSVSGGWEFTVAPYLVAAAMDGTVGIKGHDVKLDVPFSKIWDNLHVGAMVHFDMKNDRWLLSSDLIYMNLQQDGEVANGTAEVTVTQTFFEVAGGYRTHRPSLSWPAPGSWTSATS